MIQIEKIADLEPMEMTFTIEDADSDKLNEALKDINVKECPWFEVRDKHGNKAKYYREPGYQNHINQRRKRMSDFIARQDTLDICNNVIDLWEGQIGEGALIAVKNSIAKLPSVERKKGKWKKIAINPDAYDIVGVKTWAIKMRCNQCDFTTFAIEGHFAQYNFCPRCGSQNDVVEDAMLHTYKEGEE